MQLSESQVQDLWHEFGTLNGQSFNGSNRTRFTLFRQPTPDAAYITPWYRYHASMHDPHQPIDAAHKSQVRYRYGESMTGKTWARAGRDLFFMWLPDFEHDRRRFTAYYQDVLGISSQVVDTISDYMIQVQAILSYGFEDPNRNLLSVLSLDLQTPTLIGEDGLFFALDGRAIGVHTLASSFRRLQEILEHTFKQ